MKQNLFAFTARGSEYPGYMSINELGDGGVEITIREAPTERDGVYVCSHRPGPGRCTAGGPTCNNYCNMAPQKGPMQDRPVACRHTDAGKVASFTIPAEDSAKLLEYFR